MKKILLLLILSLFVISCNELSKEELLIHNQKVSSGIEKKKADLDEILEKVNKQSEQLSKEYDNINSFKLGRLASTKAAQIAKLENQSKDIYNFRNRIKKLKNELDLLHKTFDFQSDPKLVLEKVFSSAQLSDYSMLIWLVDPYDENDGDVDGIAYIEIYPKEYQQKFDQTFRDGRIIGEPIITGNLAKIEFLFGPNGNRKETMNLIKRNQSWYLGSY